MAHLPSGTVTFLLTDVEGSTALWERDPEAMRRALARHDTLIGAGIECRGGVVVKHRGEGDSVFAVFARVSDAVAAAADLQRALQAEPWPIPALLRVRMALHTGEAELRESDYYGVAVNRCARLRSAGHGGQILLSEATAAIARESLPEGAGVRDLGTHRLRDLQRPERIHQLVLPDLLTEFPALASLDGRPNNLPVQPTPLIGREREVDLVGSLLLREDVRLLTLTGPGGTGKTRLGLEVAADGLDYFEDGVFFVALAPISDPALVIPAIAQTLGVREAGGRALLGCLKAYLRGRDLLLVLDNFDQLLGAAPLVADLLAACTGLKILVTSRAVLNLRGEREFPVLPLALPDRRCPPPVDVVSGYPSVALFVQRAADAKPSFVLTAESAPAVVDICYRVDGLPLAIELAATRVKLLSPEALLARLERRLPLLTGGARDLPARQQTLRDAIAWSHELLDRSEQRLFRRLAVFVGGFTLDAVEAICNPEGDLDVDVLDGLASLVAKSLLRQEDQDGEPRFAMLETIREYGLERLEASGEADVLRREHARYYLALVEATGALLFATKRERLRTTAEQGNVQTALRWLVQHG